MKSGIVSFILCCLLLPHLCAQENSRKVDTVVVIQQFKNLYQYENFNLSGQPTYEMLLWLKDEGVKRIINLRSEKENIDFSTTAFNEEKIARDLGFEYFPVPVDGPR